MNLMSLKKYCKIIEDSLIQLELTRERQFMNLKSEFMYEGDKSMYMLLNKAEVKSNVVL